MQQFAVTGIPKAKGGVDACRGDSIAVDRDAMIPSVFFGDGVKAWSTATPGNKIWFTPDVVKYDYNLPEARKLLASLHWQVRLANSG